MPGLRVLSGFEIGTFLEKHGFFLDRQRGSHMTFKRKLGEATNTMTVPNHRTLHRGTSHGLFKEACKYISEEKVVEFFYKK